MIKLIKFSQEMEIQQVLGYKIIGYRLYIDLITYTQFKGDKARLSDTK